MMCWWLYISYKYIKSSTETDETEHVNLNVCIITGKIKPNDRIAENPTSHEEVLTCIQEWASYDYKNILKVGRNAEHLAELFILEFYIEYTWFRNFQSTTLNPTL